MTTSQKEWKKVYKKKCDAALRLVYADWLEERGDAVAAAGWRIIAHLRPRYKPEGGGSYEWYKDGKKCGGCNLPKKWFEALDGKKYSLRLMFRRLCWKTYETKYDAFDALARAIGKCVLGEK